MSDQFTHGQHMTEGVLYCHARARRAQNRWMDHGRLAEAKYNSVLMLQRWSFLRTNTSRTQGLPGTLVQSER